MTKTIMSVVLLIRKSITQGMDHINVSIYEIMPIQMVHHHEPIYNQHSLIVCPSKKQIA